MILGRRRDRRQPSPVLCVMPDQAGETSCTFLAGHNGPCSNERARVHDLVFVTEPQDLRRERVLDSWIAHCSCAWESPPQPSYWDASASHVVHAHEQTRADA